MKIRMALKDPDTMPDAVEEAVQADTKRIEGLSEAERVGVSRSRTAAIEMEISDRWMRYGEYLLVEFDTETWTATVLPASEME